jgi:hypothetical protein
MSGPPPVLVVGTGRCGSTLVSEMMRAHPEVLSLSELFSFVTDLGSLIPQAFVAEPVPGAEFWRVMATCYPRENLLLRHGLRMEEVTYPFERGRHRWGATVGGAGDLPGRAPSPERHRTGSSTRSLRRRSRSPAAAWACSTRGSSSGCGRARGRVLWVERSGGTLRIVSGCVAPSQRRASSTSSATAATRRCR